MAAFNTCKDLNDIALKPRLLRVILNEHLPDEKRPLHDPTEMSSIISTLKLHKLLSEEFPPNADQTHVSDWKSAFDAWVNRVLMLCSSDLPDKRWAGVCLLGVTSMECSSARFLASHSAWFDVLLSNIQPFGGTSQFVKVSSCAAVSDLLARLGGFSNQKKNGNSYAGKLVQPILKMFNEDKTDALSDVAAHLLLTILNHFPQSVQRHQDSAEGAIVSKIMSANCNADVLEKLSCCLASLPKSKGDEDSWYLMMQKILLSLSALLNITLEGLEEETRRVEAVTLLVPPGKDPPPSLGGQTMTGEAFYTGERSQKMLMSSISSLTQCCCIMLSTSYPVQVAVPVSPLLAIIKRVLMVNGSLPKTLQLFTTTMQQEFVCLQLPVLHLNMLEVLAAVIKGLCSQLLPHAADISYLLMIYLKTCCMPELRTKVYSIIRALLISMGAGMALYISGEVIDNILIDLEFSDSHYDNGTLDKQPRQKKRKLGASNGEEQQVSLCLESKDRRSSIALEKAALETLEALLVMGGALSCDSLRRRIDDRMIEVATNAFRCKEMGVISEDFILVALRALLASILSPAGYRPPYLSKGLELFQKGKQNTGTKVAEFCSQALVALEVLIHPRALPLIDTPLSYSSNHSLGRIDFGCPKNKLYEIDGIFSTSYGDSYGFQDELYLEDISASEDPGSEACKDVQFDEKSVNISMGRNSEEPNVVNGLTDNVTPMETVEGLKPANLDSKIEFGNGRLKMNVQHDEESNKPSQASVSCGEDSMLLPMSSSLSVKKGRGNNILDARSTALKIGVENVVTASVDNNTSKVSVSEQDDELSDSFPDIVDADPDTDSD